MVCACMGVVGVVADADARMGCMHAYVLSSYIADTRVEGEAHTQHKVCSCDCDAHHAPEVAREPPAASNMRGLLTVLFVLLIAIAILVMFIPRAVLVGVRVTYCRNTDQLCLSTIHPDLERNDPHEPPDGAVGCKHVSAQKRACVSV